MAKKSINILLLGRSGCGKGAQGEFLIDHFGLGLYISTGELFRALAEKNTLTGRKIAEILGRGGLPGEWIAQYLWQGVLVEKLQSVDQGILFDGLARRVKEAVILDEVMAWLGLELTVVLIEVTRDEAFKRLKGRERLDDTDEKINSRLDWYDDHTSETVDYYENKGRLIRVDGMPDKKTVFENILKALGEK